MGLLQILESERPFASSAAAARDAHWGRVYYVVGGWHLEIATHTPGPEHKEIKDINGRGGAAGGQKLGQSDGKYY